jgi:hypothetical protein
VIGRHGPNAPLRRAAAPLHRIAPPPQPHSSSMPLALQEYEFERQFNEDEAIRWMQENW